VSRHRRLQKTLRSPQRLTRQSRNRFGRRIGRELRSYFAEDAAQPIGLPSCYWCGAYENSAPLRETGIGYWRCRDLKACGQRVYATEVAR
jgi:ribosomal protein L37AE/L43A